jgi:hypothetical protein
VELWATCDQRECGCRDRVQVARAPSAAVFIPSPRLNLSLNVITARVVRSSNPLIERERLRSTCWLAIVFCNSAICRSTIATV